MGFYHCGIRNSSESWNYNSIEKAKRSNSAKVGENPGRGPKYPDWQVLETRRLIENEGWASKQVANHLKLPLSYIQTLRKYACRAHLVPDPCRKEPYTP